VPGSDSKFGWGGACFPKDTSEFTLSADAIGTPLDLLKTAIELNRKHRQ